MLMQMPNKCSKVFGYTFRCDTENALSYFLTLFTSGLPHMVKPIISKKFSINFSKKTKSINAMLLLHSCRQKNILVKTIPSTRFRISQILSKIL